MHVETINLHIAQRKKGAGKRRKEEGRERGKEIYMDKEGERGEKRGGGRLDPFLVKALSLLPPLPYPYPLLLPPCTQDMRTFPAVLIVFIEVKRDGERSLASENPGASGVYRK